MIKNRKVVYLIILLLIIVGFIGYTLYEKFQIIECSTIKNCKTCANSFGCLWCKKSSRCISDLSKNTLCFRESTVSDPFGCEIDSVEDVSGSNLNSPLFGGSCSANKDCSSCLRSPDCFWCNDSQKCAGSVELYAKCKDDRTIYNSSRQCAASRTNVPESSAAYDDKDSVIPKQGLSRIKTNNLVNDLTSLDNTSLKIIFDSLDIKDIESKEKAINRINKEMDFYSSKFKTDMNMVVNNAIDFVSDPKSLDNAKITKQRIQDLRDISRYVNDYGNAFLNDRRPEFSSKDTMEEINSKGDYFEFFTNKEKFIDTYKEKDEFDYTLQKNKYNISYLELFWFGNIVALGTLYYFMRL